MARKTRIVLGLLILAVSLSLLVWGLLPARHERRILPIPPSELQLPTPASLHFDAPWDGFTGRPHASLTQPEPAS